MEIRKWWFQTNEAKIYDRKLFSLHVIFLMTDVELCKSVNGPSNVEFFEYIKRYVVESIYNTLVKVKL